MTDELEEEANDPIPDEAGDGEEPAQPEEEEDKD